jgi:hypothetical protein
VDAGELPPPQVDGFSVEETPVVDARAIPRPLESAATLDEYRRLLQPALSKRRALREVSHVEEVACVLEKFGYRLVKRDGMFDLMKDPAAAPRLAITLSLRTADITPSPRSARDRSCRASVHSLRRHAPFIRQLLGLRRSTSNPSVSRIHYPVFT